MCEGWESGKDEWESGREGLLLGTRTQRKRKKEKRIAIPTRMGRQTKKKSTKHWKCQKWGEREKRKEKKSVVQTEEEKKEIEEKHEW